MGAKGEVVADAVGRRGWTLMAMSGPRADAKESSPRKSGRRTLLAESCPSAVTGSDLGLLKEQKRPGSWDLDPSWWRG